MKSKTMLIALVAASMILLTQSMVTLLKVDSIDKRFTQFMSDLSMTDAEIEVALKANNE